MNEAIILFQSENVVQKKRKRQMFLDEKDEVYIVPLYLCHREANLCGSAFTSCRNDPR